MTGFLLGKSNPHVFFPLVQSCRAFLEKASKYLSHFQVLKMFSLKSIACCFCVCLYVYMCACTLSFSMPFNFLLKAVHDIPGNRDCERQSFNVKFYIYLARSSASFTVCWNGGFQRLQFPAVFFPVSPVFGFLQTLLKSSVSLEKLSAVFYLLYYRGPAGVLLRGQQTQSSM